MPAERHGARSPHEAIDTFRQALCQALSCVTNVVPQLDSYNPSKDVHVATLSGGDPVFLKTMTGQYVGLIVTMQYRVVEEPPSDDWFIHTAAYEYKLTDRHERELLVYHWHPEWRGEVDFTHLHLQYHLLAGPWRLFEDKHLPTGRVALEDVLWTLPRELEIAPNRPDWRAVLQETRAQFEELQTWSGRRKPG